MLVIMNRSRALVLSVVMLSLVLVAGCQSERSTTPPPPPSGTPVPPADAAKDTKAEGPPISDMSKDSARGYKPPAK